MAKLTVVPTPVGNLDDMTFRAVRVLRDADIILAEDTRTTSVLLHYYTIKNRLQPYHKYNEHRNTQHLVSKILSGLNVALVSDAGTPSISDPGFLIVRECIRNGIDVECLPGATALIPALVASGFPSDRFCFEGFLPSKKGRRRRLQAIADEPRTCIIYESPFRLVSTLNQLSALCDNNQYVAVCRELSKIHEEIVRGTFKELIDHFSVNKPKGEIVIVTGKESPI